MRQLAEKLAGSNILIPTVGDSDLPQRRKRNRRKTEEDAERRRYSMSRKIDPVVPLAYSAEMLQASVIIGTSNSSVVADFLRGGLHIAGDVMMSLLGVLQS